MYLVQYRLKYIYSQVCNYKNPRRPEIIVNRTYDLHTYITGRKEMSKVIYYHSYLTTIINTSEVFHMCQQWKCHPVQGHLIIEYNVAQVVPRC